MKTIIRLLRAMLLVNLILFVLMFSINYYVRTIVVSQLSDLGSMALHSFKSLRPVVFMNRSLDSPFVKEFMDQMYSQQTIVNMFVYEKDSRDIIYAYKQPNIDELVNSPINGFTKDQMFRIYDTFTFNGHNRHMSEKKELIACIVIDGRKTLALVHMSYFSFIVLLVAQLILVYLYYRTKKMLKMYEISEKRLNQFEQEATIGRLASVLAHEIKNPLSSMKGLISYALKKSADNEVKEQLDRSIDEVDRLSGIVNGFLTFGKPLELNLTPFSIMSLIDEAVYLLKYDTDDKKLSLKISGEGFEVLADKDKILQVLVNLMMNAIEASKEEDVICIELNDNAKEVVIINLVHEGVLLEDKFFKPFYTTKAKGSGLGLSISKKIMDIHNFSLIIEKTDPFTVKIGFYEEQNV